jgi:hypothetical protein
MGERLAAYPAMGAGKSANQLVGGYQQWRPILMSDRDAIIQPLGSTAGGLPYPEDTDAVMLGAQAIKALANAIDNRPWIRCVRWTGGTLGGSADALLTAWDLKEGNFTRDDVAEPAGFVVPANYGGLWQVMAFTSFVNTFPAGVPQFSVGVFSSGGAAVAYQRGEMATSGNQRRDYQASGVIRLAAGEWVRAFQNNYQGISGLTYAGGTGPQGNRYSSRFAARWVGP